jgi:hypothetical protein
MMDTEPLHIRRRRELEAVAPTKRKKVDAFVKVPLPWIAAAANHVRSPATLVMVELLYASWKARRSTFSLPNVRLAKLGVSREIKRRVIRDLERGGLITVERKPSKSPIITLVGFE